MRKACQGRKGEGVGKMKGRIFFAGVAALFGLGAAWFSGLGTPGMQNLPRPFSSDRWKAATDARCAMVLDLRNRIGLVGRTRKEILQLLGWPDGSKDGLPAAYALCPSFVDIFILELAWKDGRVVSTRVRDT
jgi:hypothetical protein